ncbi:MAG: D-xylose transport system ATP-binding protein [Thermoleophilaceae bacterium]|nr:D-xylose transport system ATP-binding protein [Thermoleophilaceae bacterium]
MTATAAATPVLSLKGISKRFGAVQALTDAEIDVMPAEVVALVGDNGAGKSTLVKVISGVGPANDGTILWEGKEVTISRPQDAQKLGIATVYQDLALADNLDVVGNLFLGQEERRFGVLDDIDMERQARELLQTLSVKIPSVRTQVASLSGGQRQSVAIARSLLGEPKVVILDEPTAALGVAQTAEVLSLIKRLKERGYGVLLISHNLADIFEVADRIVVLRLGRMAGLFDAHSNSSEDVVAAITGASDSAALDRERQRLGRSHGEAGSGDEGVQS